MIVHHLYLPPPSSRLLQTGQQRPPRPPPDTLALPYQPAQSHRTVTPLLCHPHPHPHPSRQASQTRSPTSAAWIETSAPPMPAQDLPRPTARAAPPPAKPRPRARPPYAPSVSQTHRPRHRLRPLRHRHPHCPRPRHARRPLRSRASCRPGRRPVPCAARALSRSGPGS
jgi:hypothetical protein